MKIGIIKEGKTPPDKRVPFTPKQCKLVASRYPNVELRVQESSVRSFPDDDYKAEGIEVVSDLNDADVIFGVKEVNIGDLLENKTYFFFSHTIKQQPYNRKLLRAVLERKITLIDYECLTEKNGRRLVGFGRYAGIVGCYNAFLAFGQRSGRYELKAAHKCFDRNEMEAELVKVSLPEDFSIVLTGLGRVAGGAIEILEKLGIKKASPEEFISERPKEPTYTQLSVLDYFKKSDNTSFTLSEAYQNPERFESDFFKFAKVADLYIPCHYYDSNGPNIFDKEELKSNEFNIRTIADISCDIDGPIPSTIRASTIAEPIYHIDRKTRKELPKPTEDSVTVMAVDNLPCELPKDASEDFGIELLENILPNLLGSDNDRLIDRATIAAEGRLKPNYEYLSDYVKGA